MPFNPEEITPTASINRVRIMDLPGLAPQYALREEERGKTAYDLLSAQAVYDLIREQAHRLELQESLPEAPSNEIMVAFQRCFESLNPSIQATAQEIRAIVHRRIAILLAVLRRGDPINREARPEWDESYWAYWGAPRQVIIGGGLLRDHIGLYVSSIIKLFFVEALEKKSGLPSIRHDPYGSYWPLVGTACIATPDMTHMAVLDFGGTSVKSGIAHYHQGALVSIKEKGSFPSPLQNPHIYHQQGKIDTATLFQNVVGRIAETIQSSPHTSRITHAVVSLASYIDPTGHPYPISIGGYAAMQFIAPNLQSAMVDAVSEKVGKPIQVRLIHDGTAAATAYPGRAVLIFGTAIGVGSHRALPHINLQASEPPANVLD